MVEKFFLKYNATTHPLLGQAHDFYSKFKRLLLTYYLIKKNWGLTAEYGFIRGVRDKGIDTRLALF
jgi:hypothetical protein